MTETLQQAILRVRKEDRQAYGSPHASEIRECAEVDFVPGEKTERNPYATFQDGSKERHFAIVSNIGEWSAERLIQWHREKAGTGEEVQHVVKNEKTGASGRRRISTVSPLGRVFT